MSLQAICWENACQSKYGGNCLILNGRTVWKGKGENKTVDRKNGQHELAELTIPTWTHAREAIQAVRTAEALKLLENARVESEKNNDVLTSFLEQVLTHVANLGEEEVEKVIRQRYHQPVRDFLSTSPGVMEILKRCTESQRRHLGNFTVSEEPDRYVVKFDPCGTGGRLRRTRSVGTTKKAYPWSWGKAGVPYYCCHCCIHWEIIPTEVRGYPNKIVLVGDRPEDPCVHLFYKKPELIPEEYFKRIGKTKAIK